MSKETNVPKTMSNDDLKQLFKDHPLYKLLWKNWKHKTIKAKDANTKHDIIVVGISNAGCLIGKIKYTRNEYLTNPNGNVSDGWRGSGLNITEYVLTKYKSNSAIYTFRFNLVDDGE